MTISAAKLKFAMPELKMFTYRGGHLETFSLGWDKILGFKHWKFGRPNNHKNLKSSVFVGIYKYLVVFGFVIFRLPKHLVFFKRRLVALICGFWVGRISHRFVFKMKISKYSLDFQGKWCHIALGDSDRGIVRAKLPQWIKRSTTLTFWKFSKFQNFLNF